MRVGLFLKYDREIGKWSENREIPDLWGRVDRYADQTLGMLMYVRPLHDIIAVASQSKPPAV